MPRIHFFVPFGVDAYVPWQSLQEEQELHDPGSHLGLSGPLVILILMFFTFLHLILL
ncbi:hypothetical protein RHGRI_010655 [Rhododendron griersonianum]|uniref:Uncharacterized protein n=1 Tax=Rhododendron griersonianum TaxID=479676 RepID=A0AAV6KJY0_9ERIC|nr:hypothetical protein RHGRI_010655 [Rhododendron griersonianum]